MTKQKLVHFFFEKNYMMSPDLLRRIPDDFNYDQFLENHTSLPSAGTTVLLTEEQFPSLFSTQQSLIVDSIPTSLEVIESYIDKPKKREMKDFVLHMKARYLALKEFLQQRSEMQNAVSISKALTKNLKEPVTLIGIVYSKEQTKNGNWILELEDFTGMMKVLVHTNNKELIMVLEEVILDEVIGITGVTGNSIVFANQIYFPEIPLKEYKKTKDDVAVAFISDLHVGSKLFAQKEFERFIDWMNLKYGTDEQKELAKKVKYLVITGDLIDGVGIYPSQEKESSLPDVYQQYGKLAGYLGSIRKDVKIVCCGGNHDALRLSEPQPPLSKDFAHAMYQVKNLTIVSNPAYVRLHGMFDVLMYHGYSFDYYMNNVNSLRNAGGYDASEKMMEFILRKRHISPTHVSTLKIPDIDNDPLVIRRVPDFFVTGHIHYDVKVHTYKNVTLIGCASFQYKTAFQEKIGHVNIIWGKIPIISLKTRMSHIMDFRDREI